MDSFKAKARPHSSAASPSGPIRLRQATLADLPHILHHRRAMFHDMGHRDSSILDAMEAATRAYLQAAVAGGRYLG